MIWRSWEHSITSRIRVLVATYDWWVGGYYDSKHRHLYIMVPFIGLRISLGKLSDVDKLKFYRTVERGWYPGSYTVSTDEGGLDAGTRP
jgi:hypothetical protein